jgi:uracil-DNA glycosylase family 4
MQGFLFNEFTNTKVSQARQLPQCGKCGLNKKCRSPMIEPYGECARGIMIVIGSPSLDDDIDGRPLTGEDGRFLEQKLAAVNIDLWRDCIVTHAVACCPFAPEATVSQVNACRPNLWKAIEHHKPKVIIPLGNDSVRSLFSHRIKQDANIQVWRGHQVPDMEGTGAWVCPMSDISFMRNNSKYGQVAQTLFEQDLQEAVNCLQKPLPKALPIDNVVIDRHKAIQEAEFLLETLDDSPLFVAVDYETNMLKPHSERSRVKTVSFHSSAISPCAFEIKDVDDILLTREILTHRNADMIAANMLFEIAWSREWFSAENCNWVWDTVLAAHVLDNRRKVAGTKFQAFVNFGVEQYDKHISKLLEGDYGYGENRIDEIPIDELLRYNAIDALVEFKLAKKQMKEFGA